jgi:hypothetical protein
MWWRGSMSLSGLCVVCCADVRSSYAPEARRQSIDVSICFYMHMKLYTTETS